jgi:hypothetical protein
MNLRIAREERIATAALFAALIWVVIGFVSWQRIANGVRVGSPFTTHDYGQHLLFDGSVQTRAVLGVILLHFCAAVLGYAFVVRPIWGNRRLAAEIWLVLAGVIPGTLLLMALSRITTLFVPNLWAPGTVAVVALATTLYGVIRIVGASHRMSVPGINWASLGTAVTVLLAVLIFTVHIDRFHVVGEASVWFMDNVFLSDQYGIGSVGRFPFVSQHYDEAALLYPVIYGLMHRGADDMGTFTAIYWIMIAIGRVGVGALLYIAARSLGANRLSSMIVVAFVCCASLSLNPISSHLLFDSLSPLAYALHVARFLICVLPLVLVAVFANWENGSVSLGAIAVAVMLGVGFSSMPVHGILILLWGIVVAVLAAAAPLFAGSPSGWRAASAAALIAIIGCALAYAGGPPMGVPVRVAVLLGGSLAGALILVLAWFRSGARLQFDSLRSAPVLLMLAICFGYAVGLIFLGNVFIPRALGVLAHIWPWSGVELAERGLRPIGISSWQLMESPYCEEGYPWGFRVLTGHCGSLAMFVRTYGLASAIMTFVVVWKCSGRAQDNPMSDRQLTCVFLGIALCILALPLSFFIFDFLSPQDTTIDDGRRELSVWLRSRLVEPWFYGGMLLGLVLFLREAPTHGRRSVQSLMMIAIGVFGLSPLVMPAQMIANVSYLFRAWIN